jgi:predicted dehydrogenase
MRGLKMSSHAVRIGVIGTGIGMTHIEMFQQVEEVEVVAVCSARRARAEEIARRFCLAGATDDYRDLLTDGVDAVVVASPPGLHLEMGLAAIEAGKHVFMEKPFTTNLEDARRLRDAIAASALVGMVNFHNRYAPVFQEMARLVGENYVGEVVAADILNSYNPVEYLSGDWASDSKSTWFKASGERGGYFANSNAPHDIDRLLWLAGPIQDVTLRTIVAYPDLTLSTGSVISGITSEDGYLLSGSLASGGFCSARGIPLAHRAEEFELIIHGSRGSLKSGSDGLLYGASGTDEQFQPLAVPDGLGRRLGIAAAFAEAIRTGQPAPAPTFQDGFAVQAVIEAALASREPPCWNSVARE